MAADSAVSDERGLGSRLLARSDESDGRRCVKRDVDIKGAPKHVEWLIEFLGRGWVRRSLVDYRGHPYRAHFRVNCHSLLPGLAAYDDWRASKAEPREMPEDAIEVARQSAHIQALKGCWGVSPQGKKKEYLRQRLKDRKYVDGALFELAVGYHHVAQGRSVDIRSITVRNGFDLLVQSNSGKAEIECKTTRRGAGRKIHPQDFEALVADLWSALEAMQEICLLDVLCDDRLRAQDVEKLSAAIYQTLSVSQPGTFDLLEGRYRLNVERIGRRSRPLSVEQAEAVVAPYWADQTRRPHMLVAFDSDSFGLPKPTISLSVLLCRSKKPDNVLRPLMAALSKASKQVSGTRPSLVCIHVPEPIDWSAMRPQSALARQLYEQFQQHRRLDVVSGVAFSGLPADISRRAVLAGTTPAIFWANPRALHELPDDFKPMKTS